MEPVTLEQHDEVEVSLRAQKYRQAQVSSIDEKSRAVVALNILLEKGIATVTLPQLRQGAHFVGQAL